MDNKKLTLTFSSAVEQLTEINSSFDKGVLRVAYHGKNRNGSFISKESFERNIKTMYNCPVVCNYNRETDSIGAHDVEIVKTGKGMKLINITQPVGIVPESAHYWWEEVEEENGDINEYLFVEVIIWKRQEAYSKIKENGITDESMEINVKSGKTLDGYYHIDSFEFTAFCLLESAEPCFESAGLEMFSLKSFHDEYTKMMAEFKECFTKVTTSAEDDIDAHNAKQNLSKGGNISLDRMELLSEYGLTLESLDFNIDDFTVEELREKLEAIKNSGTPAEPTAEPAEGAGAPEDGDPGVGTGETFSLTGEQFREQVMETLHTVKYTDPYFGEMNRYMYVDYDTDNSEVFCYDCEDWRLYGFKYSMNGDNVAVDFDSKKRKKLSIVDFDEGSADFDYKCAFESFGQVVSNFKDVEIGRIKAEADGKLTQAEQRINDLTAEVSELSEYKNKKMGEEREILEDELFSRFEDLGGIEAFEDLRKSCGEMTLEEIESKCYELRGRHSSPAKFSANKPKSTRIIVDKTGSGNRDEEPYGGLYVQFPPTKK